MGRAGPAPTPQRRLHRSRRRREIHVLRQHPLPHGLRRRADDREVHERGEGQEPRELVLGLHYGHERGGEGQGQDRGGRARRFRDCEPAVHGARRPGPQVLCAEHDRGGLPGRHRRVDHLRAKRRVRDRLRARRPDPRACFAREDFGCGQAHPRDQQNGRHQRPVVAGALRRNRSEVEPVPEVVRVQGRPDHLLADERPRRRQH
mmetsp:Transcript_125628/g.361197  ORF Transcript_125628/g.361197 Transcript_125628/m.361197 type:complete len:204 (-) Transcript_125628:1092-1703(-)